MTRSGMEGVPLERRVMLVCRWIGCKNRVKQAGIACWLHARIERKHSMERCKEAFETWHGIGMHMDIQTEVAWENWQAAWNAARNSLTDKAQKAAYDQNCTIWLTEGTHVREKFAYEDGHHRGWHDAKAHLTHNAPHEGPGAASSRTVPLDAVVGRQRMEGEL